MTSPVWISKSVGAIAPLRPSDVAASSGSSVRSARPLMTLGVDRSEQRQLLADHLGDEFGAVEFGSQELADVPAVAQDRDAVADRVHLVEEVRHEQDRHAAITELTDDGEQLLDLGGIEARRRLVEDEHLRIGDHRTADRHQLLHRQRQRRQRQPGVEMMQAELGERLLGAAMGRLPPDPEWSADLVTEHHVLADREVRAQVDLLVHDRDAGRLGVGGAVEPALLAVDHDLPGVDGVDAGQCLDERGLARTVLAHEGVDLARQQPEVDRVERLDAREGDRDAAHLDDR